MESLPLQKKVSGQENEHQEAGLKRSPNENSSGYFTGNPVKEIEGDTAKGPKRDDILKEHDACPGKKVLPPRGSDHSCCVVN